MSAQLAHRGGGGTAPDRGREGGCSPFPSLPTALTQVITFPPPTPFPHSSSPLPAGTLLEDAVGSSPAPPEHTPCPGQQKTQTCFPCEGRPRAKQHSPHPPARQQGAPRNIPLVARSPFAVPRTGKEKAASTAAEPSLARKPRAPQLPPPLQSSPLAIPEGKSKRTVPTLSLLSNPKSRRLFHYFGTRKRYQAPVDSDSTKHIKKPVKLTSALSSVSCSQTPRCYCSSSRHAGAAPRHHALLR